MRFIKNSLGRCFVKHAIAIRGRCVTFAEWCVDAAEWRIGKIAPAQFAEWPDEAVEQYAATHIGSLQCDTSIAAERTRDAIVES
jgi:hypothetical protein